MKYENTVSGVFIERPNRFIARVSVGGEEKICHVKNTGRCRELLLPGARVILQRFEPDKRKTEYDLIAVYKGDMLINMDSQAPNAVFGELLSEGGFVSGVEAIKPECRFGDSRFDFYFEAEGRKCFAEVKGVTLEQDGVVMFPDAPTERGVKHLKELTALSAEGYEAYVLFVVAMEGMEYLHPNDRTHRAFGDALREAEAAGVRILAVECAVTPDSVTAIREIPVKTQLTEE